MMGWAALLFVGGVALIFAEFLLPGLICGIAGALMLVGSTSLAIGALPDYAMFVVIVELLGASAAVGAGFYTLSHGRAARGLRNEYRQDAAAGFVSMETDASLLGAEGVVLTPLRPAGTIEINGRRIDAVSEGTAIDAQCRVRVIDAHGMRVVVEAIENE